MALIATGAVALSVLLGVHDIVRSQRNGLRVVDGDTIVLAGERVRIYGLDCPELRDKGGLAAKQTLMWMLTGATITLKRRSQDRYGRTVAKVFADGRDVACQMIRAGVCKEFLRYSRGEYEQCR